MISFSISKRSSANMFNRRICCRLSISITSTTFIRMERRFSNQLLFRRKRIPQKSKKITRIPSSLFNSLLLQYWVILSLDKSRLPLCLLLYLISLKQDTNCPSINIDLNSYLYSPRINRFSSLVKPDVVNQLKYAVLPSIESLDSSIYFGRSCGTQSTCEYSYHLHTTPSFGSHWPGHASQRGTEQ